jgi:hypothetical protein
MTASFGIAMSTVSGSGEARSRTDKTILKFLSVRSWTPTHVQTGENR